MHDGDIIRIILCSDGLRKLAEPCKIVSFLIFFSVCLSILHDPLKFLLPQCGHCVSIQRERSIASLETNI